MPSSDINKLFRNVFDSILSENQNNLFAFDFNYVDQLFFGCDKNTLKHGGSSIEAEFFLE